MNNSVAYEERFRMLAPAVAKTAFPLPLPWGVAMPSSTPKWWVPFLDFAENYVQLSADKVTHIPYRFRRSVPQNVVLVSAYWNIIVGLGLHANWAHHAKRNPQEVSPELMHDRNCAGVLRTVQSARAEDWPQFVVAEYNDVLQQFAGPCNGTCCAQMSAASAPRTSTGAHVERVLAGIHGFTGLVSYDHIRKMLLASVDCGALEKA